MRSYMRSELCDLPRSRNAFLAQLVGPRRAQQQETEWVHLAGAWVGMVYVWVPWMEAQLSTFLQPLFKCATIFSPPLDVTPPLLSSLLPTWLQCLHPPFFSFCFGPISFLFSPIQCNFISCLSHHPLSHFYTFLSFSWWFLFLFFFSCVKTWKIEASGSSGCLFPHHFYHSVLVADCCRCFLC